MSTWARMQIPCTPICVFRRSIIELLRQLSPYGGNNKTLGSELEKALREDQLFPVFHLNAYRERGRFDRIKFQLNNYYDGLDNRVRRLLRHVDQCINKFGEDVVLAL